VRLPGRDSDLSNLLDYTLPVPADEVGVILERPRHALAAPLYDPDPRLADAAGKVEFEVDPVPAHGVHARDDEEHISVPHLSAEIVFEGVGVRKGVVRGHAKILPPEVTSLLKKSNDAQVVFTVVPNVADENSVNVSHAISPQLRKASEKEIGYRLSLFDYSC
jgi:hypothetical protein